MNPKKRKREKGQGKKDKSPSSEHTNDDQDNSALATSDGAFLIGEDNYLNLACVDCTWIVDLIAFYHLTSQ